MANFDFLLATRDGQIERWLYAAFFAERAPRKVRVRRPGLAPLSAPLRLGGAGFTYWALLLVSTSGFLMR
jgi:hypothetical protein